MTCLGRKRNITGYIVRTMRTGENDIVVEVAGDVMEATVSGLYMATEYTVQVAAVNSFGTGPCSDPLEITTRCMLVDPHILTLVFHMMFQCKPQLLLMCQWSRMVLLVSQCIGVLPIMPLDTSSTTSLAMTPL